MDLYCEYQQPEWKSHRVMREMMAPAVDATFIPKPMISKKLQVTTQTNLELVWILQQVNDKKESKNRALTAHKSDET